MAYKAFEFTKGVWCVGGFYKGDLITDIKGKYKTKTSAEKKAKQLNDKMRS